MSEKTLKYGESQGKVLRRWDYGDHGIARDLGTVLIWSGVVAHD